MVNRYSYITLAALCAALIYVACPATAFAAIAEAGSDAVGQVYKVNFNELLQGLVAAVGAILVAAGASAVRLLTKKVGIESESLNQMIYEKLHKAVDLGVQFGIGKLEKAQWTEVSTKNAIVAAALEYVVENAPDLMKKAKVDEAKIVQIIEARLHKYDQAPGVWNQ